MSNQKGFVYLGAPVIYDITEVDGKAVEWEWTKAGGYEVYTIGPTVDADASAFLTCRTTAEKVKNESALTAIDPVKNGDYTEAWEQIETALEEYAHDRREALAEDRRER